MAFVKRLYVDTNILAKRLATNNTQYNILPVITCKREEQLGIQCYHLFARYPHALKTIAVLAAGDYWTFRIVHRYEIPRASGDSIGTAAWDQLHWPVYAKLSSPISDGRLQEIYNILRTKPVLDLR